MKILVTQFEPNIQGYKQAASQTNGKAKNINGCIAQIFVKTPGGNKEVISQHK
jgi:hypothetical protein